jgi:hypothetical protein
MTGKIKRTERVAYIREMRNAYKNTSEDLGTDGRILLKLIL